MKLYVIMQKATEYNDEGDEVQEEGAKIYKAFRNRPTQEQIDAAAWDAIKGKTPTLDGWPDDMAYVEEIEVEDDQIVQPEAVAVPSKKGGGKPSTYAEAQANAAAMRVAASKLAKEAIYQSAKAIFEQYPDLESFSWTQYTPYFNDGDECTFGVRADYPTVKLKGIESEGGDPKVLYFRGEGSDKVYTISRDYRNEKYVVNFSYGKRGGSLLSGTKTEKPVEYSEAQAVYDKIVAEKKREGYGSPWDDIRELLTSIDEDDMKSVFGDHVEVTATRGGFDIETYSHD